MSTVLKRITYTISPFHNKDGTGRFTDYKNKRADVLSTASNEKTLLKKRRQDDEKIIKKVAFQLDKDAPNNNMEYIKKIENHIILKLVTPTIDAETETDTDTLCTKTTNSKAIVEHIEDKNGLKQKAKAKNGLLTPSSKEKKSRKVKKDEKEKEKEKDKSTSDKRLNAERIKKMIEFDNLYFKDPPDESEKRIGMYKQY